MQRIFISFANSIRFLCKEHSFLSSPKETNQRKVRNVLSSEAGCNIIVIIRRTRFAQTASHVDLLVSLRDPRIEEDSENSTPSKDLLVRNVFEREYGALSAVTSLLAWLVQECFRKKIWSLASLNRGTMILCNGGGEMRQPIL